MMIYGVTFLCVLALAVGQLLFKASANALAVRHSVFTLHVLIPLLAAMVLYGLTSLVWVWILQKTELGRIYPMMALAFVFVPIASHFLFGERFSPLYFLGMACIIIGILMITRA